jgi:outer membrane protein
MKINLFTAAALGAVTALSFAQAAGAQAAQPPVFGLTASAAGVCVVSSAALLGDSSVGTSIENRMKQLVSAVNAEVSTEQTAIETEKKSIEAAAKAATTPAQQGPLQTRAQALQTRFDNLQRKAQQRDAELRQTQAKAVGRVGDAARPLIRSVANSKNCGLVLDSNSVADANPAMDITSAVVQQLNSNLPSITFDREHLDTPAAAPQNR